MMEFRTEAAALRWLLAQPVPEHSLVQKMKLQFTLGWPDLYVLSSSRAAHYELKAWKGSIEATIRAFEPIQVSTLIHLEVCGACAKGLILQTPEQAYLVTFYGLLRSLSVPIRSFKDRWSANPAYLD